MIELFTGADVVNANRAFHMLRTRLYVCPLCGNIILSAGGAVVSCCGIVLPALEAEEPDEEHMARVERVEDEYFVSIEHPMSREHHVSFLLAVRGDGFDLRKLYPEGPAEARFPIGGTRRILYYCNRHGLFSLPARSV